MHDRVGDPSVCPGLYVVKVTKQPVDGSNDKVADWLAGEFGGTWTRWKGGDAGIPGADLWAQFRDDADGKKVLVGMLLLADGITSARLRSIPVGVLEDAAAQAEAGGESQLRADLAKLPPLERGELSTDDFYRLVAEHFKVWARHGRQPVAAMVRETGEKSTTVHAWVNRARSRGFLPPVERGKRVSGRGADRVLSVAVPVAAAAWFLVKEHPELVFEWALRRWL